MEEKVAISRIKQGDLSGLEVLVRQYQVKAVYAAFVILQDRSLAEEVAQNAFLKVVDKINLFDDTRSFAPWFFRIVANDAIKTARKQSRLCSLEEETDYESQSLARWMIDPQPSPEKQIEIKENVEILKNALQQLSPDQRAVVMMRYYLNMNNNEMAIRLEKPVTTIKWWLRTARKKLGILIQTIDPSKHRN
jgi:RNA polymerase sigma-70 factor (ECF subfamily)